MRQGQILFDIETDKSVMEVESPGSGVIRDLAPITGEPVAVGTVVGWIDADAEAGGAVTRNRGAHQDDVAIRGNGGYRSRNQLAETGGARGGCGRRALGLDSRHAARAPRGCACST